MPCKRPPANEHATETRKRAFLGRPVDRRAIGRPVHLEPDFMKLLDRVTGLYFAILLLAMLAGAALAKVTA
jgi:hypothetical protein